MIKKKPFLSIIIPLYNKERTIHSTLQSVLSQSFSDFELLIINDGSTDKSVERIQNIKDDRIRIISKQNGGPSSARNVGIQEACGEYAYFLDADDRLVPDALQTISDTVRANSSYKAFSFNFYIKDGVHKAVYSENFCEGRVRTPYLSWLLKTFFVNPGSFVANSKLLKQYKFANQHRRYEDIEFFFKIIRENAFFASSRPIFEYNQDSLSASIPRKDYREDFCCSMEPIGKPFWEQICLYRLYLEAKQLYPNNVDKLYGNKFEKLHYKITYSLLMRYLTLKWMISNKENKEK